MTYPRPGSSRIILARPHFLCLGADRWPPFFIADTLVQDLPDQPTQAVGDRADGLSMAKPGGEPAIHDGEDRALGLNRSIGGLIEDAAHLAVIFGTAVTVEHDPHTPDRE